MKTSFLSTSFLLLSLLMVFQSRGAAAEKVANQLEIGTSISITKITPESMRYAKSVGVSCIEIGFSALIEKGRDFNVSDEELQEWIKKAKEATDDAGIEVWSIHMPFGEHIDLSLRSEEERQRVVALHKKLLGFLEILQPKIILFHPSWYLGLNERVIRKEQLIKSATELNEVVMKMGATLVIENMLGPELLVSSNTSRESPLCRTVVETVEIMDRLPHTIYSAIDMNHIKHPEQLILAMGGRLKTIHVADGDGLKECHYFPCSGEGENDWTAILAALDAVNYRGPFLFESAYDDVKDLKECYEQLYAEYRKAQSR